MRERVILFMVFWTCLGLTVTHVHAQSETRPDRQLRVLEPKEEIQDLDPAFEMIMEKIDGDLKHILSSPVRLTPKGTAITGLTVLGTLFLLNEDDEYLSDIADTRNGKSNKFESARPQRASYHCRLISPGVLFRQQDLKIKVPREP
jgi:hypothetical protein